MNHSIPSLECTENKAKAQVDFDKVKENQAAFEGKVNNLKEAKKEKTKDITKVQK